MIGIGYYYTLGVEGLSAERMDRLTDKHMLRVGKTTHGGRSKIADRSSVISNCRVSLGIVYQVLEVFSREGSIKVVTSRCSGSE